MSPPLLEVDSLEARYGSITALHAVSLEVNQGEIVSVIGPNGAGKSTLLETVAGGVKAAAGKIRFRGEELKSLAPEQIVRKGISLVPEGRRIFHGLTVDENLRLGATIRDDEPEVADDIKRLGRLFPILAQRPDARAGNLSGGEQQMLAIARALLSHPSLLMLDEPSLGLAPGITASVFSVLEDLRREGVTILLVEQHARKAVELSDRTYVLKSGHVDASGASEDFATDAALGQAYFGAAERQPQKADESS